MERSEPTFVPEWLKTANGGVTAGGSLNHHLGSSLHSDDHVTGNSSRNRLSVSTCDHDRPRPSAFADRTSSSSRRSTGSNGSLSHDKESLTHSRPYSSFGRSNRDRDREKEDINFRDRERSVTLDNGYRDFPDSLITSRSDKDTLRRSQSMVSGRRVESWPKRTGSDTNNGVLSSGSIVSTIHKASFERDFPSLGAEDKQGPPEIGRASSPGLSSAIQNLPLGSSTIIGGDAWTSALAEVPIIIGGNGSLLSSVQQTAPASSSSTALSTTTGLNMAETLAQAPFRARAAPQLSVETQRLEELAIKQSRQLIPMTPSMPKASVLNSSEKLKPKGARSGDFSTLPKVGQHSSSQPVNHTLRGSSRSDVSKISQVGNFQVLNRERNVISPTARDGASPTNATRVLNPLGVVSSAAIVPPLKSPNNLKLQGDSKAAALLVSQSSFAEKRSLSQAQNRNDFFNSLRKKTSTNHLTAIPQRRSVESSILEKSGEQITGASTSVISQGKDTIASDTGLDCLMVNGNSFSRNCDACGKPERFPPSNGEQSSCSDPILDFNEEEALEFNEEETRFMRSLGWDENAGVEALTAEEINAFIKRYGTVLVDSHRPSSKLCRRQLRQANTVLPEGGGSSTGFCSSDAETEV